MADAHLDLHDESALSGAVIGAAIEVHRYLGPGMLETVYQACLERELVLRGIPFASSLRMPVRYKGMQVDAAYRLDLLVDEQVVVEIKSVEQLMPVHTSQVLTYLRLTGRQLGLLINFNVPTLVKGVRRVVNGGSDR